MYMLMKQTYTRGNINDVIGTTQELYYNPNNPEKVASKINFVNFLLLIIGIKVKVY